jgi:hypothetical protein
MKQKLRSRINRKKAKTVSRGRHSPVKDVKKLGVRLGNWLTVEQAHSLWQAPNSQGLKRKRTEHFLRC